jgi:hypothetical protein
MNCHKTGYAARNCHTTAQSRLGLITFADLAAGRRVTNSPPPSTAPVVPLVSSTGKQPPTAENTTAFPVTLVSSTGKHPPTAENTTAFPVTLVSSTGKQTPTAENTTTFPVTLVSSTGKQTPTAENTTAFPVLTRPRQKHRATARARVTTNTQKKPHVITNSAPNIEHPQTYTYDSEKQNENCQASVSIDAETPEPSVDIPKNNISETKKSNRMQKQQMSAVYKYDQSENTEDRKLSDAESFSSNDSDHSQELLKTPRDKTTTADNKAIDTLCAI